MFRKRNKTNKISKETFDEWKKRADDLIDKYVAEEGANLFNPTKENKKEKKPDKVIIKDSEGDDLSEARIRQSEKTREKQKKAKLSENNERRKKLRQALIFKEVLDEPVSKRSKAKRV